MDECDVLVVGGGPAGSTCATRLVRAGLDVVVIDRSQFPRDKVCAGWITPQVIETTGLDIDDYRQGRTFQPIRGFRTGAIGRSGCVETAYGREISFGIRRIEFDHYLLQRSQARLKLGVSVASIRREGLAWIVNDSIRTSMLVGAGGHFCPIARWLNPPLSPQPFALSPQPFTLSPQPSALSPTLVVAQEAEFPIDRGDESSWAVAPELPELYFSRDLAGYGWCFRKQGHINIGIGRLGERSLPSAASEFVAFLRARHRIPINASWRWRGHAYLISEPPRRLLIDSGILLAGDAAGLAYPESGEGIRPAIESGLLAANTVIGARGHYTRERLAPYEISLRQRFLRSPVQQMIASAWPPQISSVLFPWLLDSRWLVRHLVLDRWFLHAGQRGLAGAA